MNVCKKGMMGSLAAVVIWGLLVLIMPAARGQELDHFVYLPLVMKPPPVLTIAPPALACGSNAWTVAWSGGDEAVSEYVLEEAHDAAFTSPTVYTTTETSLAFNHAPSVDNVYTYRVRADGSWGAGPWSQSRLVVGGFYDDFADAGSGWATTESDTGSVGYVNGQYRVQVKKTGYLISAAAPDAARDGYTAEVEAQWAAGSATDGIYGLVFGANANFDKYYFLAARPDGQFFRLYFYDASLPVADRLRGIMSWTASGVINSGAGMNKLAVTRIGGSIQVRINETNLGAWNDGALTGPTYAGVMATSNLAHPAAEARFDRFELGLCGTVAMQKTDTWYKEDIGTERGLSIGRVGFEWDRPDSSWETVVGP